MFENMKIFFKESERIKAECNGTVERKSIGSSLTALVDRFRLFGYHGMMMTVVLSN